MRGLYLAAAAACALVAGQAGAAVTAVGGSVIVQGTLDTNNPGSSAAESFTGSVFQSLSKSIDLENADNTNDVDFLGSLVLKSASEGDLSGYAYAYNALVSTVPGPIDRTSEGYGAASYTFSIDRASYLKLDGDQTIITSNESSSPATLSGGQILSSNGQGFYKLAPGQYSLGIAGSAIDHLTGEFPDTGDIAYINGEDDGASWYADVHFTISAVPEPASWAMMIGGLGFVGTSLRRRDLALA